MRYATTLICALLTSSLLTACSSVPSAAPTPYKEASGKQGYGFSSVQLTETQYRVLFKATEATPADLVQEYSLLRAAEIASEQGFRYIAVLKTDVDKKPVVARKRVNESATDIFPPDQQCTMSGCTEPARATPVPSNDVTIETGVYDNVYYSILVRMGNDKVSTGANAMEVKSILASRPDNTKR